MNPHKLYLTQTDTTVGFVSLDPKKLAQAKNRDSNQPFLIAVDSFKKLKNLTRIPKTYRKRVRRSCKTSFLYPNKKAIRVVRASSHARFLKRFDYLYTTSANKHKQVYDFTYAWNQADIVVEDNRGLYEGQASNILKLGKKRIQRLR